VKTELVRTLAIIGHRALRPEDIAAIRSSLLEWWSRERVSKRLANAPTLLTSLAPGADQLGASVLTGREVTAGMTIDRPAKLRPVFPYDEHAYENDVELQESDCHRPGSGSFGALADKEARRVAKRLHGCWNDAASKNESYRTAGRYLAEHADILISLWDGVYSGKIGGTSDTIGYALSARCQEERARKRRRALEVHWLVIPRLSNPHPAGEAFTWQRLSVLTPVVKPRFNPSRVPLGKTAAIVSLALASASCLVSVAGYWLNLSDQPVAEATAADRVLTAISHLVLNSFDFPNTGSGTQLVRIGRWLAVGFALTTIASVMNGLFRWVDNLTLRWFRWHLHDLICGLGWRGCRFMADSPESKVLTVAIERTPDEATRMDCAQLGVKLVEGDATNSDTMRKVRVSKVRCAYVACDKDETNIQVVHQLTKTAKGAPLICCVGLRSQESFQILQNALPEGHKIDLRIFNAEAVTARMFLKSHPIDRFRASSLAQGAEVIMIGDSPMAQALLREVLQQGIFEEGKELAVAWLVPDASITSHSFASRYPVFNLKAPALVGQPWVAIPDDIWRSEKVLPEIRFFDLPVSDRGLLDLFEGSHLPHPGRWVTSVVVALNDPAISASVTYTLAPHLEAVRLRERRDITLSCYYNASVDIYRSDIDHALNREFQSLPVQVFSDFMGDCSKEVVRADDVDRVARRVNGIYCMKPEELLMPGFDKRCDEIWPHVTEDDKDSNRQAAAHAWVKRRIRARLRANSPGVDEAPDEKTPSAVRNQTMLRALAEIEHRRWCAEYLLKGFRPLTRIPSSVGALFSPSNDEKELIRAWFDKGGPGKKAFKRAKRHVDLVPFKDFASLFTPDLVAEESSKDYRQIGELDRLLQ
jgi:Trk K+ transport system NAD-binding subunit